MGAWAGARWTRRRRQIETLRVALRASAEVGPLPEDLPAGLRWLVIQARTLRALLEGPLRALQAPPWAETPWARRERCDAWDLAVAELRRAAWDWRLGFARLDDDERQQLEAAGLARVPLTGLWVGGMDRTTDPWEQVVFAAAPDAAAAARALRQAAAELSQFEQLVVDANLSGYRQPA